MKPKAVIFDMDGLLIDSEPLWQEAGIAGLAPYNIKLTTEQYLHSTGLRTPEWLAYWFNLYGVAVDDIPAQARAIEDDAMERIRLRGTALPGVEHIINFFLGTCYRLAIASSSPKRLIDVVVDKLGVRNYMDAIVSAETLSYGKPHPQVFLDCAQTLQVDPLDCVVFEDSFNGMIAAKAAKMKCVVVPVAAQYNAPKWGAADLRLRSLGNFNQLLLDSLW